MTDLEYDYATCDMFLQMVNDLPDGYVSREVLEKASTSAPVPDEEEVIAFLVEDGLLKELPDGFQITHRGRILVHEGGFQSRLRRARRDRTIVAIGVVSGIIAAIASILSLLL